MASSKREKDRPMGADIYLTAQTYKPKTPFLYLFLWLAIANLCNMLSSCHLKIVQFVDDRLKIIDGMRERKHKWFVDLLRCLPNKNIFRLLWNWMCQPNHGINHNHPCCLSTTCTVHTGDKYFDNRCYEGIDSIFFDFAIATHIRSETWWYPIGFSSFHGDKRKHFIYWNMLTMQW